MTGTADITHTVIISVMTGTALTGPIGLDIADMVIMSVMTGLVWPLSNKV
jgi:hypothetical protein